MTKKGKFCPYRTTFTAVISLYIVYLVFSIVTRTPLFDCIINAYDHMFMRAFIALLAFILVLRGEHLQAVLLVVAYLLTYLVVDEHIESMHNRKIEESEENESEEEEKMLDFAEYTDTPVGKAYNPKENYIGGLYDFTGHLKYDQLRVVP